MVSKLIGIGLLVACSMFGQSGAASTSVYYTIYTNGTTAVASGTVPNIGQVGHQVFLVFTNAPAKTCTAAGNLVNASLQFSYDNTVWFNFGNPQTVGDFILSQTYSGTGSFPYTRFNLTQFDTTNCIVNGFYTGSSNAANLAPTTIGIGATTYVAKTRYSIPFTPIATVVSAGVSFPLYTCDSSMSSFVGAISAGTTALLNNSGTLFSVGVCSITFTSTGVATAQLVEGTGTNCGTSLFAMTGVMNLIGGVPITLGGNLGFVANTVGNTTSTQVCLVVTGAAVNINARVNYIYR